MSESTTPLAGAVPSADRVAREFEGLFLSTLLKQLRQTDGGEGLFPGDSSDTFGGIFDMYLGNFLAEQGGIGLAKVVAPAETASPQPTTQAGEGAAAYRTFNTRGHHDESNGV